MVTPRIAELIPEAFGPNNCFYQQHVISADQFDPDSLAQLIRAANCVRSMTKGLRGVLKDRIMATFFTQESTRTRLSFEAAMRQLGGEVISTTDASRTSSLIKGETLEDAISIVSGYCDVIVLRHHETGSVARVVPYSQVPVINAGDGRGEHPTQALVDVYTIWCHLNRLDSLKVAVVGDLLFGRTVHSLLRVLALYPGNTAICVSDPELALPNELKSKVEGKGLKLTEAQNLAEAVETADVVYMTGTQVNLFEDKCREELVAQGLPEEKVEEMVREQAEEFVARARGRYILTRDMLPDPKERIVWVMHPLPRMEEIPAEIDSYPGAIYFEQAKENALAVRRALLAMVLGI